MASLVELVRKHLSHQDNLAFEKIVLLPLLLLPLH